MPISALPAMLDVLESTNAVKDALCRCAHLPCSCSTTRSSIAVVDIVEHDDHHHAQYEPLIDALLPSNHQSKLTFHPRNPIPIHPPPSSFASSSKQRSFSEVSDASSRPSLSSSPTDSSFSSPPSSPFLQDHRGRSPSFASSSSSHYHHRTSSSSSSRSDAYSYSSSFSSFPPPDPYRDITQIRRTSRGNHVLYPGASFSGTQKSGRNNYEVSVTVVDVDFDSSFLCGYLRIKGLTDDYPELTTYFDAEIIGEKFGFLTTHNDYGATETEDMTHWGRFPAFRTLKNELHRPGLTVNDRHREKRGVVFMRWKERFLVPDWKVKDINGASFAGFYYVCVEFNPTRGASITTSVNDGNDEFDFPSLASPHRATPGGGPATMTGFYYHAESEPYQQLSLTHVPEKATPTFEFR